ncbi:YjbG polysaccharide synthesis-related protein [Vibrio vulnificus]|nr:YjbG polysaccharide synthesis-related protein [Vibrio vulnificus]
MDIDAVRLKADLNPALPGHYALKQASRENKVLLLGLIDQKTVPFSAISTWQITSRTAH